MRSNYQAWEVRIQDFLGQKTEAERIRFLLRFATLAPSGHNTQPWNFSIEGNAAIFWVNKERSLAESDPKRRQLLIAFGCMVENFSIAADYYGFDSEIRYASNLSDSAWIARISLKEKRKSEDSSESLIIAIPLRRTNRGKYSNESLPAEFLGKIEDYSNGDIKISIMTDSGIRHRVADIVNDAQIETMESPIFREELSHYIKSSFTKEHVGMPGFALEIPAPVSLFVSHIIKKVNVSKQNKRKDDALLKNHTPAFILISSRENKPEEWLKAGRVFERIWLMATKESLSCSPMAAAIQSEKHTEQLKEALKLKFEPQVFFRIGYAEKEFRHSPRFSVDQLLK